MSNETEKKHEDCCCFKCCLLGLEIPSPDCGCEGGPAFYSIKEQEGTCKACPKRDYCDVASQPELYIIDDPANDKAKAVPKMSNPITDAEKLLEKDANGLLPCPFCGGKKVEVCFHLIRRWRGVCSACQAEGPSQPTGPLAKTAWNTRPEHLMERLLAVITLAKEQGGEIEQYKKGLNTYIEAHKQGITPSRANWAEGLLALASTPPKETKKAE